MADLNAPVSTSDASGNAHGVLTSKRLKDMGDGTFAEVIALGAPVSGGVTIRTNAGSVAPGQSLKTYTGTIALSTTVPVVQTLETVSLGKTFYITDINISSNNANQFLVEIQANGVDIFASFVKGDTAPCTMSGIESQPSASSLVVVTLKFGIAATATTGSFFVAGFEQ